MNLFRASGDCGASIVPASSSDTRSIPETLLATQNTLSQCAPQPVHVACENSNPPA